MDPRWSSHNNTPSLNSWNPSGQTSTPTDTNPQSSPGMPSAFLRPQATPSMRSGPSTLGGIHAGDTSGLFGPTPFQGPRHTTPAMMILPSSSSTVQQQQQQHQQGQPPFGSTIPAPSTQSTQIQRPTGYTGAPKRVDLSGVSYQEVLDSLQIEAVTLKKLWFIYNEEKTRLLREELLLEAAIESLYGTEEKKGKDGDDISDDEGDNSDWDDEDVDEDDDDDDGIDGNIGNGASGDHAVGMNRNVNATKSGSYGHLGRESQERVDVYIGDVEDEEEEIIRRIPIPNNNRGTGEAMRDVSGILARDVIDEQAGEGSGSVMREHGGHSHHDQDAITASIQADLQAELEAELRRRMEDAGT